MAAKNKRQIWRGANPSTGAIKPPAWPPARSREDDRPDSLQGMSGGLHWDIAVIHSSGGKAQAKDEKTPGYDFLQLEAVVEFGLNATKDHLKDDIQRVAHRDANVRHGFVVHTLRFSGSRSRKIPPISGRDLSFDTGMKFLNPEQLKDILEQRRMALAAKKLNGEQSVEIYLAIAHGHDLDSDLARALPPSVWRVDKDSVECVETTPPPTTPRPRPKTCPPRSPSR